MSKAIDEILNRWFRDDAFRQQLKQDPQTALAEYQLTTTERQMFLKMDRKPIVTLIRPKAPYFSLN
jgi:hypothetical protein